MSTDSMIIGIRSDAGAKGLSWPVRSGGVRLMTFTYERDLPMQGQTVHAGLIRFSAAPDLVPEQIKEIETDEINTLIFNMDQDILRAGSKDIDQLVFYPEQGSEIHTDALWNKFVLTRHAVIGTDIKVKQKKHSKHEKHKKSIEGFSLVLK